MSVLNFEDVLITASNISNADEDYEDEEDDDDGETEAKPSEEPKVSSLSSFSFGGATTNQSAASIFGGSSVTKTNSETENKTEAPKQSIFSGLNLATSSSSLFGGSTSTGSASTTTPSLFGGLSSVTSNTGATAPSIFGISNTSTSESTPAFGTSIFGSKPSTEAATTNIFAAAAAATTTMTASQESSKGVDFTSASKNLPTFGALSTGPTGEFTFGKKTEGFSFDGAGASVFGSAKATTPSKPAGGEDSAVAAQAGETTEDADHDPHFEPIIPLPELVNVTTGEEEEEIVFKHRAKVYRCVLHKVSYHCNKYYPVYDRNFSFLEIGSF